MRTALYNPEAGKKAANLSISSDLLRQAKAHRINLSKALEGKLLEMLQEIKRQEWKSENQKAIEDYNRRIQSDGVFSEKLRSF